MRVWKHIALAGSAGLALAACAAYPPHGALVTQRFVAGEAYASAHVSDRGRHTAWIRLGRPADKGVLATSHRWVAADVFEYRFILQQRNASGAFVDVTPAVALAVSNKAGYAPAAAFNGLEAGRVYRIKLQAWGNAGGTAATSHMNAQTATVADIDLTASNDLETDHALTMQAVLDPQVYSGAASVGVTPPGDATPLPSPGLGWIGQSADLAGGGSSGYGADGTRDGHFRYIVELSEPTVVKDLKIDDPATSSFWSTSGAQGAQAAVYVNGVPQLTALAANGHTLGTYSGRVVFDIYINGLIDSWITTGRQYEVRLFNGASSVVDHQTTTLPAQ